MTPSSQTDIKFMKEALNQAIMGKTAFGCVIAEGDEILIKAHNTVKSENDVTAHAEINAIRKLGKVPNFRDKKLTLYTTGEPCPMCMTAIMYAGINKVVYAVPISDISKYYKQVMITSHELVEKGFEQIEIKAGILYEECLNLFKTTSHDKS
jgi:tRNA(Arg) A34 adenosine deaminase TadA